jgi:DNA-binding transcriptional ArsR family regulator
MSLARTAGLLADPTRAAFCVALLDGRAWTSGELARHAGVAPSTASEHLSQLVAGGLLVEQRQGRHRYVQLSGTDAADLVESLTAFGAHTPAAPRTLRESHRHQAEARARTCYDHLAGHLGVSVADALVTSGYLVDEAITDAGRTWLGGLDIDITTLRGKRPLVRRCVDWTERRSHLAGAVGAALCRYAFEHLWVERVGSGRALRVTPAGRRGFGDSFGLDDL